MAVLRHSGHVVTGESIISSKAQIPLTLNQILKPCISHLLASQTEGEREGKKENKTKTLREAIKTNLIIADVGKRKLVIIMHKLRNPTLLL